MVVLVVAFILSQEGGVFSDLQDAEDIVQSTFWRMLDRIASYDDEAGGGERWLWSICKNLATFNELE